MNHQRSQEGTDDGGELLSQSGFNLSNSQVSQFKTSNLTNQKFNISSMKDRRDSSHSRKQSMNDQSSPMTDAMIAKARGLVLQNILFKKR